jgi:SAM-dependent methyltransferase
MEETDKMSSIMQNIDSGLKKLWRQLSGSQTSATAGAKPDTTDEMVSELRTTWEEFATQNPMFYINSRGNSLDEVFEWDEEAFFSSGRAAIDQVNHFFPPGDYSHARLLEIGCGLGRESIHLAQVFGEVVGIDIAPSMVEQARRLHSQRSNIQFVLGDGKSLRNFEDASFDAVYSHIVLQHILDVTVVANYIFEAARVLRPGGPFVFQLFDRPDGQSRSHHTWVCTRMGMPRLRQILPLCGLELVKHTGEGTECLWVTTVRTSAPQVDMRDWNISFD